MDFRKYQQAAFRTTPYSEHDLKDPQTFNQALALGGLGVAGEAGEVADYLKKVVFHDHPLDVNKVRKELGDVLWYVAFVASVCGLTLDDIAVANIDKLLERYPNGFNPEQSLNRKPGDD